MLPGGAEALNIGFASLLQGKGVLPVGTISHFLEIVHLHPQSPQALVANATGEGGE